MNEQEKILSNKGKETKKYKDFYKNIKSGCWW